MSSYDNYDDGRSDHTSSRYYEERRYQRDPRYAESRDSYSKPHTASRDLVPRSREESEYGVEEIRRDFPPPTYSRDVYYDDDRYSRSGRDRGLDRRDYKKSSKGFAYSEEEKKRRRVLSNQEKIMAAVIGGALAVGGKELFDRREAKQDGHDVQRNALSSAALGAAGAFAAYQGADYYSKHSSKEKDEKKLLVAQKGRGSASYYSDDESDGDARNKKGRKNFLESALAAAGLGSAVSALRGGGDHDDRRSDTRSRRGSRSRSRSGSRSGEKSTAANKIQKAAMASLLAGATEAFRVSKEPGGWQGEKAKRIFTAAAGAATIDAAQDDKQSKMGLAQSVIGGLLGNRLMNGSRNNIEEDKHTGRSRSRSRARSSSRGNGGGSSGVSGLAALATAGLGALGAKKIADSHERSRSRRRSADSYDSRARSSDRHHRSRSRSVVDTARRSLAKLGLGKDSEGSDRDRDLDYKSSSSRRRHRRDSTDSRDDYSTSDRRRGGGDRDRDYERSRDHSRTRDRDDYDDKSRSSGRRDRRKGGDYSSESDLGSSSEDEKKARKMKDKHRRR